MRGQSETIALYILLITPKDDGASDLQVMQQKFRDHEIAAHEELLDLKAMANKIQPEVQAKLRYEGVPASI